jgi:hypothetical protein
VPSAEVGPSLAPRVHPKRRHRLLGVIASILVLVMARPAAAAFPSDSCLTLRPLVDAGRTDVLGDYAEVGVRCLSGPWSLELGTRFTEATQTTWPVGVLSYDHALDPSWHLLVVASARERVGDYEANRLPEVTLRWKPPVSNGMFSPSIEISAGSLQSVQFGTQALRAGVVATVATPSVRMGSFSMGASIQAGDYTYGTGQNSSFYVAEIDAGVRISDAVGLELIYVNQQGFGTSPLVFDFVNLERVLIARLDVAVGPDAEVALSTSIFVPAQAPPPTPLIPSPPSVSIRDASIVYSRPSQGWSIGVGWHQVDGRVFLIATLQ